jgi:hypothetical protein
MDELLGVKKRKKKSGDGFQLEKQSTYSHLYFGFSLDY